MGMLAGLDLLAVLSVTLATRAAASWPTQSTPPPAPAGTGAVPWLQVLGLLQVCLLCGLGIYACCLYRLWRRIMPNRGSSNDAVNDTAAVAPAPRRSGRPSRSMSGIETSSCPSVGAELSRNGKLTPTKYRGLMDVSPSRGLPPDSPGSMRTFSSAGSPQPENWPAPSLLACTCSKAALHEGGIRIALARLFCGAGDNQSQATGVHTMREP
mmetsp:Transcript_149002/g.415211  ORF Transcript_149002/g.415211 Transcript_149002/m.415211 type:complete len:211 (-) Transcript_149002:329-961(-)